MSEKQGYGFIQTYTGTVFSASTSPASASIDITDFNNITLQLVSNISESATLTTASITINSSLNGVNWVPNTTIGPLMSNSASLLTALTGRRYIQSLLNTTGNITSSLYVIAGQ